MRLRHAVLPALASLSLLAVVPSAFAQSDADRATARSLGQDGEAALEAKDFKKAEDDFRRADRLVHAPTLGLGLARALAGEGKYVESQETYNRIIREGVFPGAPPAFQNAVDAAKKEVDAVSAKVAGATITVTGPGGTEVANPNVVLDGVGVNAASLGVRRLVDPGTHVLKVSADGYKAQEVHFTVTEGLSVNQPVTLEKDPNATATPPTTPPPGTTPPGTGTTPPPGGGGVTTPPPPVQHSTPILPIVAFGVGGAGLLLGAITGGIALGDHSTLANKCTNGCPSSESGDLDSYHTMGMLSTVGFIVAGVGAATGAILLLTAPKETTGSGFHVTPAIGLGSVGAVGSF
jgi:hypothetical protein